MKKKVQSSFIEKMQEKPVLGMFMKTGDPAFVEASGYAGVEFAILDMEHGPIGLKNMENNIRAAELADILPIVRIPNLNDEVISQVLDIGAAGIQVPHITSLEDIKCVKKAAHFSPDGERGMCRFVRAAKYSSTSGEEYFSSKTTPFIVLQIEGQSAIDNIDSILEEDGYHVIFIGPYDLSQSLGLPGQIHHPKVIEAIDSIVKKAKDQGKTIGIFADTHEDMKRWMDLGVNYIAYSVDMGMFTKVCKDLVETFNDYK